MSQRDPATGRFVSDTTNITVSCGSDKTPQEIAAEVGRVLRATAAPAPEPERMKTGTDRGVRALAFVGIAAVVVIVVVAIVAVTVAR